MTDYNDGKWHAWNGGEYPVHPQSIGDIIYGGAAKYKGVYLRQYRWDLPLMFRVTKAHKEPREWWITNNDGYAHESLDSALRDPLTEKHGYVHVREVIE